VPGRLNAGSLSGDGSELSGVRVDAADVDGLSDSLATRAPVSHTHSAADMTNPTGGDYRRMTPNHGYPFGTNWSSHQSITITAPSDGHVLVFASVWAVYWNSGLHNDGPVDAFFEVTHNTTADPGTFYKATLRELGDGDHLTINKGFPVTAGNNTFHLIQKATKADRALANDIMLSAIFFPTRM
jgi:hypothetical protein